jgi:plasmid maintenance system antidote protein VapI
MDDVAQQFRDLYGAAVAATQEETDPQCAYVRAKDLRDLLDELVGDAAGLRAQMALRMMREQGLSTAQLAERLGVSKARAGQLVAAARVHAARMSAGTAGE